MNLINQTATLDQLNLAGSQQVKEKKYWKEKYREVQTPVHFPYDTISEMVAEVQSLDFNLDAALSKQLMSLSDQNHKALHVVLMTGIITTLHKYSGASILTIGTSIYKQKQTERPFINAMLPIQVKIKSDMSFREILMTTKASLVEAVTHQNYPLELLGQQLGAESLKADQNIFFDTSILLSDIQDESGLVKFPHSLGFSFFINGDNISCKVRFNTARYNESSVKQFASHTEYMLSLIAKDNTHQIGEVDILSDEEQSTIIRTLDQSLADYPLDETIITLFKRQVTAFPDRIALDFEDQMITYQYLDKWSNQLAHALRSRGVNRNQIVAIYLDRSLEMIVAILGVLKSGASYLPISIESPPAHMEKILKDSQAKLLITDGNLEQVSSSIPKLLNINDPLIQDLSTNELPIVNKPEDIAYIIYTSGTTGTPKGVMIPHENVVRLLFNDAFQFSFSKEDRWVLFHEYNFDFSVWEMYGALLYGASLLIIPKTTTRDFESQVNLYLSRRISILNQTPTAFSQFVNALGERDKLSFNLRYVIFGGEALKPSVLSNWKRTYPEVKLVNMYGITETTVHVTYKEVDWEMIDSNSSNIGNLIPTLYGYVVSDLGKLVPIGVPGELWIGGVGVAKGYLNSESLTSKKFIPNPFNAGEVVYKSGDIVKLLSSGELEYIGRKDQQIQLKGHRIELGEIEKVLLGHQHIANAFVTIRERDQSEVLCAYWIGQNSLDQKALRKYLEQQLPKYMLPHFLIELDAFPMNNNGKIDTKTLPKPEFQSDGQFLKPRTKFEQKMQEIWKAVLKVNKIGIRDNYFHVGGDSIHAINLLNKVNKYFQTNLRIVDLYKHDTIESLCKKIAVNQSEPKKESRFSAESFLKNFKRKIWKTKTFEDPNNIEDILPMSDIEKGMVYHSLKDLENVVYHEQVVIDVKYVDFDYERFGRAIQLLMEKHDILRSSFLLEKEAHIIFKEIKPPIQSFDISGLTLVEQRQRLNDFLEAQKQKPFAIVDPPLWRMSFFDLGNDYLILVFELHHAILDGWSQASFFTELNNLYIKLKSQPAYIPQKLQVSFRDFIIQEIREKKNSTNRDFWRKSLSDYKRLEFIKAGNSEKRTWGRIEYHLGKGLFEELSATAKKFNTSLKHLCFAAYVYTIYTQSNSNDLLVGLTSNNRPLTQDSDKLIGCFLNTIPIRLKIPKDLSWEAYIRYIDQHLRSVKQYDKISLMEIMKIVGEVSGEENPFFDTKFNFIDFHVIKNLQSEEMSTSEESADIGNFINENTLLDFHINNTWDTLLFSCVYNQESFKAEQVEMFCGYFQEVLRCFIEIPNELALKQSLLKSSEVQDILKKFNNTSRVLNQSHETVPSLFDKIAEEYPDRIALTFKDLQITYKELHRKSELLAHKLFHEFNHETIVPLILERSPEMIIGILGILKAGAAYLPIDPNFPISRIEFLLKDSGSELILSGQRFQEKIPNSYQVLNLDRNDLYSREKMGEQLPLSIQPNDLAYVIYTSGSTGTPKGVMIEHAGILNRLKWMQRQYPIGKGDQLLQKTPYTFDVSVWELLWWAIEGAGLIILPPDLEKDPYEIDKTIRSQKVSVMHFVPSMMELFLQSMEQENLWTPDLKRVFSSGEALGIKVAQRFLRKFPHVQLVNLYGPTEASVDVSHHDVEDGNIEKIPIGCPIDNIRLYVLDENLNLQGVGVIGELYIAGIGLARGYLNRPHLTSEKFIYHSWLDERLYATGDLARWYPNGELEYLGRKDHQVKVGGIRIELGEIEAEIRRLNLVDNVVVMVKNNSFGNTELFAYLLTKNDLPSFNLREALLKRLPEYMVPSYFISLKEWPITKNGKLDRKALKELDPSKETIPQNVNVGRKDLDGIIKLVSESWQSVLELDSIDIDTPLFQLGGNSIKAIRIIIDLKSKIEIDIHVKDIFKYSTIRKLSEFLTGQYNDLEK